jgi:hypothetical protein
MAVGIGSCGCSVAPETEAATRTAAPTATMLCLTARTLACAPPGEVAQLVEHTTENRGVASSILALAIHRDPPRRAECRGFQIRARSRLRAGRATDWATRQRLPVVIRVREGA